MDEFNRAAWEMERALNRYSRVSPAKKAEDQPRWTVGVILVRILMVGIGVFIALGAWDDLSEHFKPAQPVAVKQEAAPDITGQIRTLERMIAEAKQLNAEFEVLHQRFTELKEKLAAK